MTAKKATAKRAKRTIDPTWPKHMQGEEHGYRLNEDGSIVVDEHYTDQFDALFRRREAIKGLVEEVLRAAADLMTPIVSEEHALWQEMVRDYGLDRYDVPWVYRNGVLRKKAVDVPRTMSQILGDVFTDPT